MWLKRITYPILAAGLMLTGTSASAQGWYFGVGVGTASVDESVFLLDDELEAALGDDLNTLVERYKFNSGPGRKLYG